MNWYHCRNKRCEKYRVTFEGLKHRPRYGNGVKRCNTCKLFIKYEGARCPCCNTLLRTRRRNRKPLKSEIQKQQRQPQPKKPALHIVALPGYKPRNPEEVLQKVLKGEILTKAQLEMEYYRA